jgi:glycerophosphoryl diester phosphodiesterase
MRNDEPIIVAHRGLAGHAPENTRAAYAATLELGFGLEIDLRVTADDHIVMIHDQSLERTTNGRGMISEKTLKEIRVLDAGSWFHPSFSDQKVLTLEETLALVCERRRVPMLIALDLKTQKPIEADVCRLVSRYALLDQVIVIGLAMMSREVRERFRKADARFPTAVLIDASKDWGQVVADRSADWLYVRLFSPTRQQVREAHRAGKRILKGGPSTMGMNPEGWQRVRERGIDAMLADYPLACRREWSKKRGGSGG